MKHYFCSLLLLVAILARGSYGTGCYHSQHYRYYPFGSAVPSDNPCKRCECTLEGFIKCVDNATPCPVLTCPVSARYRSLGSCCDSCRRGCSRDGKWYSVGPMNLQDSCQKCECSSDGSISCLPVSCPPISCPTHLQVTDDTNACCKKCLPGCLKNGRWYNVGEVVEGDRCETCTCDSDNNIQCNVDCPVLSCPRHQQRPDGSGCCQECRPSCFEGTQWYNVGVRMPGGRCETCVCGPSGQKTCQRDECPNLACPLNLQTDPIGDECCPSCFQEEVTKCHYNGEEYNVGDDIPMSQPCITCVCNDKGKLDCGAKTCPKLICSNGYIIKRRSECCASCTGK